MKNGEFSHFHMIFGTFSQFWYLIDYLKANLQTLHEMKLQ